MAAEPQTIQECATLEVEHRQISEYLAGGSMVLGAVGLGAAALTGHIDPNVTYMPFEAVAKPSEFMTQAFKATMNTGAVAGGLAIFKRGVDKIRTAGSARLRALESFAELQAEGAHNSKRRRYLSAGFLAVGAALATGNLADIASGVGSSQADVAETLTAVTGRESANTYVISNSPNPELTSTPNIPVSKATAAVELAHDESEISLTPATYEWRTVPLADGSGKYTVLSVGLPQEMTGLPESEGDCKLIHTSAAKELGFQEGQTFIVDGVAMKVDSVLEGKSGMNILPILLNNEDYAKCLKGNPEQPFNLLIGNGDRSQIEDILAESGLSPDGKNIADRAFVVPAEQFISESQSTGENSGYPLVLQAVTTGGLLAGAALLGRSSKNIESMKATNARHLANGISPSDISRMYKIQADREALGSAVIAAPLILLVDAYTNSGIPGAALGPSVKSLLFVTGFTWLAERAGTSIALRRKLPKIDPCKGEAG